MKLLKSIRIERFRGILEGQVDGFEHVSILVGRNNCGKSTVAEAIVIAACNLSMKTGVKKDSLDRPRREFWRSHRKAGQDSKKQWFNQDQTHSIEFSLGDGMNEDARCAINRDGERGKGSASHAFVQMADRVTAFLPHMGALPEYDNKLWQSVLATREDKTLTKAMASMFDIPDLESIQQLPTGDILLLYETAGIPLDSHGDGSRCAV